jgi:hypothetical protein
VVVVGVPYSLSFLLGRVSWNKPTLCFNGSFSASLARRRQLHKYDVNNSKSEKHIPLHAADLHIDSSTRRVLF